MQTQTKLRTQTEIRERLQIEIDIDCTNRFENKEHINRIVFKWAINNGKLDYIRYAHNKMVEESSESRIKRKLSDIDPYYWAIEHGRLEVIKLLLELGCFCNSEVTEYALSNNQTDCYLFLNNLYPIN